MLGGLGSVTGSLIAAYVVGYLETVTAYLISPAYRLIPPSCCWSRSCTSGRKACSGGAKDAALHIRSFGRPRRGFLGRAAAALVSGYVLGLLTVAYYFGVFAMSWDLLFGFAGEVNFGPTFLIGLGATRRHPRQSRCRRSGHACAGPLAAVIGGLVLALPALRVSGPYFGLTTLVAVLMLQNLIVVFAHLTGGEIGMTVPDVIIDRRQELLFALPSWR